MFKPIKQQENNYTVDNLIIYQKKAMVSIKVLGATQIELLPGFIPGSITFVSSNGGSLNFIVNQTFDFKSLTNGKNYVELTDMNDKVITGIINDFNTNYISIITDEGRLVVVNKWKQLVTKNGKSYNTSNIFSCNEAGILRYIIDSVSWEANYNVYIENNKGSLHLTSLIHNTINATIVANNVVLVYGDNIMQDTNKVAPYPMMMRATSFSDTANISQNTVTELLTYNLGKLVISGSEYNTPIYTNYFIARDLYVINYEYGSTNKTAINADYGYKIENNGRDLPAGLVKIFTISNNITLLLGSVNVDRTPQNTALEIIIGKTTRVRAEVYKQVDSREVKIPNSASKKIDTVTINGTLINDTNGNQVIYFRDNTYNNDKISDCEPKCDRKRNYIEWIFNIGPKTTDINVKYTVNAEY